MSKLTEIENSIIDLIKNKTYTAGSKIMSENTILEKFSVSRTTARRAIQNLVSRGYLYQRRGSGTYVTDKENSIEIYLDEMIGFSQRLKKIGKTPTAKILKFEIQKANALLAEKLQIEPLEKIYYIVRLRCMDSTPIALEYSYMPKKLIGDMTVSDIENSKYDYLKKIGLEIGTSIREYFPTIPSKEVREILNLPNSTAILKIELVSYLNDKRAFEFSKIFYNQSRCKFIQIAKIENEK